ncbi:MAG: hypothetical protein WC503_05955 [Candidatus Shapirobacteria bacterium]
MKNTNTDGQKIDNLMNTTSNSKQVNKYKYLFYAAVVVLIYLVIVNSHNYYVLQKSYNNSLISSEKNADSLNKCPEPEHLFDGFDYNYSDKFYPDNLVLRIKNIGFLFPKSSYSIFSGQHLISLNNKFYNIAVEQTEGGCPGNYNNEGEFVSDSQSCTYDDEKLNMGESDTLRIWKDNNKIWALNPMAIGWGTNNVSGMVIAKQSPNLLSKETLYFTDEEVQMWKEILSNPVKFPFSEEN